jgi:hypothetical protein
MALRFACHLGLTLTLSASLGCSSLRPPLTAPAEGGPPWTELTSHHFILETDTDPGSADAVVAEFERMYAALAHAMHVSAGPEDAPGASPIELVLFERAKDFDEVTGHDRTTHAYFSTSSGHPTMVMSQGLLAEETRTVFLHELAHRFIRARFAGFTSVPTWLNEGLAQFYSTMRIEDDRIVVGDDLPTAAFWKQPIYSMAWHESTLQVLIPVHKAPGVRDLVDSERATFSPASEHENVSQKERERMSLYYTASWKLVHLLMNGPDPQARARFQAFLSRLAPRVDAREAFRASFGDDLSSLEAAYRPYLVTDATNRRNVPYSAATSGAPAPKATARSMNETEIHHLWQRLSSVRKAKEHHGD